MTELCIQETNPSTLESEVTHTDLFGEPDNDAIYLAAISAPLEEKIDKAIATIREYEPMALQLSNEGYYVAFSGGKDSIVMERLFEMSGVKYQAYYNNVTIDPPELVNFIREHYPETRWNSRGKALPLMMADSSIGTPPTRLARWCCELYKEQGGLGCFVSIGVRAEESPRRKGRWTTITRDKRNGHPIICPIVYWTANDVWAFIKQSDMPYCSLYDQGFDRLGCIGCPMGGHDQMQEQFRRWPGYERLWRRGFQLMWDKFKGVPKANGQPRAIEKFETVDHLWDWWLSGKPAEGDTPDCQMWLW